ALALRARVSTEPEGLIEAARSAIAPAVVAAYAPAPARTLRVIMIEPLLEQSLLEALRAGEHGSQLLLGADRIEALTAKVRQAFEHTADTGAVLVCAPAIRPSLRRLIAG